MIIFKYFIKDKKGFTLVEVMISLLFLSMSMMALASLSTATIKGNRISLKTLQAVNMAEAQLENIMATMSFDSGSDGIIQGADTIDDGIKNTNTGDDSVTDSAVLFSDPDWGYVIDGDGNEGARSDTLSGLSPSVSYLRRVWTIKDNDPINGVKTITVIVGWNDLGTNRYLTMQTTLTSESISNRY